MIDSSFVHRKHKDVSHPTEFGETFDITVHYFQDMNITFYCYVYIYISLDFSRLVD